MDVAYCTLDKKTYYAVAFKALPPRELEEKRRALVCTACLAKAFFRKQADSGQEACFGAKPHNPGCGLMSQDTEKAPIVPGEEDRIENAGAVIKLDLKYGATEINYPAAPGDGAGGKAGRGRHTGGGVRPPAKTSRRLKTILVNLIESEDFRNSEQIIELEGQLPLKAKHFFVNFNDITEKHEGKLRGYWGMLTDAKLASGTVWLNTGGRRQPSIPLNKEVYDEAVERFNIKDLEDLAGAMVLVIGTYGISAYDKRYIRVSGIEFITMKLD